MYGFGLIVFILFKMCVSVGQQDGGDITEFHFEENDGDEVRKPYGRNLGKSKFVDVYTNHRNIKEVRDNFYKFHPRKYHRDKNHSGYRTNRDRDFPIDRKDTLNFPDIEDLFSSPKNDFLESDYGNFETPRPNSDQYIEDLERYNDRNKYVYIKRPSFYTQVNYKPQSDDDPKDDNKFVFLQSQMVIPDSENYGSFHVPSNADSGSDFDKRPNFWTKRENYSAVIDQMSAGSEGLEIGIRPYSYIQKIPLAKRRTSTTTVFPESMETNSNKYEEMDVTHGTVVPEEKPKDTRKQINDMMKNYLAKLLVGKYGLKNGENGAKKNTNAVKNNRKYSGVENHDKIPKIDQESKFLYSNALWNLKNKTLTTIGQFFSLFTVIKFNNTECNATNWAGSWQGVCLTSIECTQSNGTALGNCASGYGTCCVFRGSCGDSSSRNCSYFKSPNYPDFYPSNGGVITPTTTTTVVPTTAPTPDPRLYWYYYNRGSGDETLDNLLEGRQSSNSDTMSCVFTAYKTSSNVQQFRIDFIDLDLAGPTNGSCINERLIITGQNDNDQVPVICGYNTGQHVYVDVSQLNGPLQIMVLSTTGARKRFKLRICQYTDSCSTSQSNCLQYYTGTSGFIQSFNYDQAAMFNRSRPGYFNNLNYAVCIRREAGYCSVTYANVRNGQMYPFQLLNNLPSGQSTVPAGQAGVDVLNCPDDYIIIDGTRLCGDRFNDGSTAANFSVNAPIVDTSSGPIVINVRSNSNVTGLGFKLYYTQNPCTTT